MDTELLNRPLFAEPTAELEREDAWSGPPGFMLGGTASPTRDGLAAQYFDAAKVLIAAILDFRIEDYKLINPALFLYRHSLELQLKASIGETDLQHDLATLVDKFRSSVRARRQTALPDWMTNRLQEIATIDPGSTAFRYGESRARGTKDWVAVAGEVYVDARHLEAVMTALRCGIANLS